MTRITIRATSWQEDRKLLQSIRHQVFVQEQQVPEQLEWDEQDENAWHWLASFEDQVIGTCRMLANGHIGRMAVLKGFRGQGIGQALLHAAIECAQQAQLLEVYLYAQTQAVEFYQRADFVVHGEEFMDAGIPHLTMRKPLDQPRLLGVHGGDFAISHLRESVCDLIGQAQQRLRILSYDLDPTVFDDAEIAELISGLARKSRYSEVRIMLLDSSKVVKRGHRLLTLHRRLSSNILLRRSGALEHDVKDNLVIADHLGIICQSMRETEKIWGNYNNKPVVSNYIEQFDRLWEHAREDKDLRQLDI